jgi:hypothetical protein
MSAIFAAGQSLSCMDCGKRAGRAPLCVSAYEPGSAEIKKLGAKSDAIPSAAKER